MPSSRTSRRAGAVAAVAVATALAVPAAANANYTGTVAGSNVVLTGDDAGDNLTITDGPGATPNLRHNLPVGGNSGFATNEDFNSDPAVTTTVPANGSVSLTILAGGGNDTINVAGNVQGATIDGEAGDDIITGSSKIDTIDGGDGADRITGFRGNDAVAGGNGNDVMIWNNGDGNDTNDGQDGIDETLITAGTANDDMKVTAPVAGRFLFERSNAPFSVDMATIERLSVTSFSGDDKLATAPGIALAMNIDAGAGADQITTGDANDVIQGGDDADTLNGTGGNDRIVGDRGNDTMNGGAGDDTLVWNNGDNSDVMNGDAGVDRVEENLAAGAGDVSTVKAANGRVRYDRLNLVPFSLNIGSSEAVAINSLGGDDELTVSPGVAPLVAITADGGSGNDTLTGSEETDSFFGGSGDDTIDPGAGSDLADGQDGNDTLAIRDSVADLARGGAGTDSATADAVNVDAVAADVESVDRTAAAGGDTKGTPVVLKGGVKKVAVKKGRASVKLALSCPAAERGGCEGTLTLVSAKALRIGGTRAKALLAAASYDLAAGQRKTITVKLPKGVQKLATKRKLAVTAQTITRDAAGNVATKSAKLTLQFPKAK